MRVVFARHVAGGADVRVCEFAAEFEEVLARLEPHVVPAPLGAAVREGHQEPSRLLHGLVRGGDGGDQALRGVRVDFRAPQRVAEGRLTGEGAENRKRPGARLRVVLLRVLLVPPPLAETRAALEVQTRGRH